MAAGKLIKLSEQQVVDCDAACEGCNGGFATSVFEYVETNPQELEGDYPYTATTGTCHADTAKGKVVAMSYVNAPPKSIPQLKAAIAAQVTSVRVHASADSFRQYTGGVYDDANCGTALNHAINAVGYGTTSDGKDYFIVRNSWGADWGEEGYIRMSADMPGDGPCGLLLGPSSRPQTN